MNITHHIAQLLYRFQCVTVPGFGAFLTETVSAKIHESNQNFYPPKKVISFNSYLKNNDGLLANHISVLEKITYDQAVLAIENEVYFWKNELETNRFLLIKNIGEVKLNAENNLVFSPTIHMNYLTSSFGLSSFVSPTIKREVLAQITELEKEVAVPIFETKYEEEEEEPLRYLNRYFKYAAVFVLSMGASAFAYISYISQQEVHETLMVQADVQKEINTKIQEATFFIDNPSATITADGTAKKFPYHIMAGAFRSEKNAERELQNLIGKGYNARKLYRNTNELISVIYGSYSSNIEAEKRMTEIQLSENKEAWLLIEDH